MSFQKLKYFVADNDPTALSLNQRNLKNLGIGDVTTFACGMKLLNHLTEDPNVVFLEYNMKPYEGLEILNKIKRFNADIHVIFLSGQEEIEKAVQTLKMGAFDYIEKEKASLETLYNSLYRLGSLSQQVRRKKSNLLLNLF